MEIRIILESPSVSHFIFGALGGIAYLMVQHTFGNRVRPIEYASRPFVGGLLATISTVSLGLPNHATSAFVGYVAIDSFDAIASLALRKFNLKVPGSAVNEPKAVEAEIVRRVEILDRARNATPEELLNRPPQ